MTNHPNRSKKAYAVQAPRGFANELMIHVFPSKDARDQWVAEHQDDGDVNSAAQGARAITSRQAYKIQCYRGDAATRSYNATIEH